MTSSVFSYPGGKTYLAPWIIEQIPAHKCYVEPLCGSASVLVNKPRSHIEITNDLDSDVVQFFEVLRDRPEDLVEWLRAVPYARDVHEEWAEAFYAGKRPGDPVERAGRFYFLRTSQFSAKYRTKSGFSASSVRNVAQKFANSREKLQEFARRFDGVQIDNRDYAEVVASFDGPETFHYFDPPYIEEGDQLYRHEEPFDHDRFVEVLEGIEGDWIVSYTDVPERLVDSNVETTDTVPRMSNTRPGRDDERIERLVTNYDPANRHKFVGAEQRTLQSVNTGDRQ